MSDLPTATLERTMASVSDSRQITAPDRGLPPGPRGRDALRFAGIGNPGGILVFFDEIARRYGPISAFRLFGHTVVLLDDAELIGEVLQHQQHRFVRDTGAALLRDLVGDGVLTTDDPAHLARRRLLQPAFHRTRIAVYAARMVEEAERAAAAWTSQTVDIGAEMTRLTLGVVGATLFGTAFSDEAARVATVITSITGRSRGNLQAISAAFAPVFLALRRFTPQSTRLLFGRERAELEAIVDPIVARRRAAAVDGDDLLATLLQVRDEDGGALDDVDVRNELITFVLAGHETTATALTWAWSLLATHPEVERRLHAELDTVLADRAPTFEDLPRLRYTANVFAEALRLYPPAAAFARRPTEPVVLGGYRIPRGASIFVSPFVTQRNPRYFPEPLSFRPERWEGEPPQKFAFFPFGGGSKMCIGEPFARTEGILVLATLARRFRLRLDGNAEIVPGPSALLRPEKPIIGRIERRHAGAAV
jgi:cytochrome P450